MHPWLTRSGLPLVRGLALICSTGCASIPLFSGRQAASRAEAPTTKDEAQAPSRSDRLRGDLAYKPTEPTDAPQPVSLQEPQPLSARPQSLQPLETAPPPRRADEPDPRAVIDWLLKERR